MLAAARIGGGCAFRMWRYERNLRMMRSMTGWRAVVVGYRLLFAVLTVVAIITQFDHSSGLPGFKPVNFFSYFTILGNSFAAAILAYSAYCLLSTGDMASPTCDRLRGANALYMTLIGVVFSLLLSGLQAQLDSNIDWVNSVLHYIMPVVVVADWLLVPPRTQLAFRDALLWLIGPAVYLGYTLIRGAAVDWYPYPFLDAQTFGYDRVLRTCIVIAAGTVLAGYAIVALGNELRSKTWTIGAMVRPASG